MKCIGAFVAVLLPWFLATARAAEADPSGYWEGAIKLPAIDLAIRVDLQPDADRKWSGTIDIPVQGLRGFKLADVKVEGDVIAFAMPGVPGDPKFSARVSSDGQTISGDLAQSGETTPFKIERKERRKTGHLETPGKGVAGTGLIGHWQGSLQPTPFIQLRLILDISSVAPGAQLGGVVLSIDQGHARMPITALSEKEGVVGFEVKSVSGAFKGRLNAEGSEMEGHWTQLGQSLPLTFKRLAKAPDLARPQDPKKPYPYLEEEVFVQSSGDVVLAGTLTIPKNGGPHPAVVLISGSGPQDRDEALMGHRPFLVLADHLTREGVAVLRYDDRGFGKSKGDFSKATHDDFVVDALAAVAFLRQRKEIDASRIGLIGHSEGGIVAPLAAQKSPEIAFIVLLAGVGVPVEELLLRQAEDLLRVVGANADHIAQTGAMQRESFRLLREERDEKAVKTKLRELTKQQLANMTEEQRRTLGLTSGMVETQLRTVLTPWFRKLLVYDPRPALEAVKCPVLALNGDKDLQVSAKENLDSIREALTTGGNNRVETITLPGRNHLFQKSETGAVTEYGQLEETFDPEVLKLISDWIRKVTAK